MYTTFLRNYKDVLTRHKGILLDDGSLKLHIGVRVWHKVPKRLNTW